MPSAETMQNICLIFAETSLPVVSREARKEVENISRPSSGAYSDAGELRLQVKETEKFKRILITGREKKR